MHMVTAELSEKRRAAGIMGGIATLEKYGLEHYIRMGKLGGRPETPTLNQISAAKNLKEKEKVASRNFKGALR